MASFRAELARKEGKPDAAIGQLIERDLCSGSTNLHGTDWRDVLTKLIFCFWFCCCLFRCLGCLGRCFGIWVLPSPFLARQRPQCLIGGCLGATAGAVGAAVAERRPNMRNKSSIFRYWGTYLAYRSATVRQIPYVGGGGEIVRYFGGDEGDGDAWGVESNLASNLDRIRGVGGGEGEDFGKHVGEHANEDKDGHVDEDLDEDLDEDFDEDCLCICFGHSSRKCICS